jgi:hypothetical protein
MVDANCFLSVYFPYGLLAYSSMGLTFFFVKNIVSLHVLFEYLTYIAFVTLLCFKTKGTTIVSRCYEFSYCYN